MSHHSSPARQASPITYENGQSVSTNNTYQFGPIGHHPEDRHEIQKLRQKITAMETARYMDEMNRGSGVHPQGSSNTAIVDSTDIHNAMLPSGVKQNWLNYSTPHQLIVNTLGLHMPVPP